MKLITFVDGKKDARPGLVAGDGVIDLGSEGFQDALAYLAAPESVQSDLARSRPTVPLEGVKLLAPISNPPRIFGIGINYAQHAQEFGFETQSVPTVFVVLSSAVIGPGEAVILPKASTKVDYEAELAVVIGKPGYQIPASRGDAARLRLHHHE